MNSYQRFALNYYLSEYPVEWDFDRVIETLYDDDYESCEQVVVWASFEDYPRDMVCELIEDMVSALQLNFVPKEEVSNV